MASPNRQHDLNDQRAGEVTLLLSADADLRFLNFNRRHIWHREEGLIVMRRQPTRTPLESHAPIIGWATRDDDNADVESHSGIAWGTNAIWFVRPKLYGRGGVPAATPTTAVKTVVYASGSYVGAIPETPMSLNVRPISGGRFLITWHYNAAYQQAEPASFEVFHDNGTGTMIYTAIGTATYIKMKHFYKFITSAYAAGTRVAFTVRAKTSGGVYSLFPEIGANRGGYTGSYTTIPVLSCRHATATANTLSAPSEVAFG